MRDTRKNANFVLYGVRQQLRESEKFEEVLYHYEDKLSKEQRLAMFRIGGAQSRETLLNHCLTGALAEVEESSISDAAKILIRNLISPIMILPGRYSSPARAEIAQHVSAFKRPPPHAEMVHDDSEMTSKAVKIVASTTKLCVPGVFHDTVDELSDLVQIGLKTASKRELSTPSLGVPASKHVQPAFDFQEAIIESLPVGGFVSMSKLVSDPELALMIGYTGTDLPPSVAVHRTNTLCMHYIEECSVCHFLASKTFASPGKTHINYPSSQYSLLIALHVYVRDINDDPFLVWYKKQVKAGYFGCRMTQDRLDELCPNDE